MLEDKRLLLSIMNLGRLGKHGSLAYEIYASYVNMWTINQCLLKNHIKKFELKNHVNQTFLIQIYVNDFSLETIFLGLTKVWFSKIWFTGKK